jgi:hypothetical protein
VADHYFVTAENPKTKGTQMRIHRILLMIVMAANLAVVGCNKSGSVDTANLEKSFASADATAKSGVEKAVSAIKSADYAGALAELGTLKDKVKLTPDQEQAVKDVVTQVQQIVTEAANKAAGEAGKAVGDLQKSLKK